LPFHDNSERTTILRYMYVASLVEYGWKYIKKTIRCAAIDTKV
jgi:hypothetical protein